MQNPKFKASQRLKRKTSNRLFYLAETWNIRKKQSTEIGSNNFSDLSLEKTLEKFIVSEELGWGKFLDFFNFGTRTKGYIRSF